MVNSRSTYRRKILHVVDLPVSHPWLNGLAKFYDRSRFEHLAVSLGGRSQLHDDLEQRGLRTFALNADGRRDYPMAGIRLARLLRREKVDMVQTHLFDPSVSGLFAAALARTPVRVVTRHHSDFTTTFQRPWHRRVDRIQASNPSIVRRSRARRVGGSQARHDAARTRA